MIGLLLLFICLTIAGIGLYRAERALLVRRQAAADAAIGLLDDAERQAAEISTSLDPAASSRSASVGDSSAVRDHPADLPAVIPSVSAGDGHASSGDGVGREGVQSSWPVSAPAEQPVISGDGAGPIPEASLGRSILIIDLDQKERQRVRSMLSGPYALTEAENAPRAIELLERRLPSLIMIATNVRDRHGHPFWEWIRRSETTASVPVIVVAAVAAGEKLDESFRTLPYRPSGVLRKPLLIEEVRESVSRVLSGGSVLGGGTWMPATDSADEDTRFVRRAQEEVERQIANPAFGVRELSEELGLSARQLQRRLRETTSQSPNAFIRSIRLQHAVRLLERGSDPVSQIAYAVGFNSLSYFAKCFREHFGRNPSAFATKRSRSTFIS